MERGTVDAYEAQAVAYDESRPPRHADRAAGLASRALSGRPLADLGCGPGGYLPDLGPMAVGLDAARAMLELARRRAPQAPLVQADLEAPPFRTGCLGGAWARNAYVHVPRARLPLALARLHQALALGAPAEPILHYLTALRPARLEITGADLVAAGIPESPLLGRALRETLRRKLDGELCGREEELHTALSLAREAG